MAGLLGALAGLLVFGFCAALWRLGQFHAAANAAQSALLLGLLSVALVTLMARPSRMTRVRVPINRDRAQAWWPREPDLSPWVAACAGAPLLAGAAAAFMVFR